MPDEYTPTLLKDWFDEVRYRSLALEVSAISPEFDAKRFLKMTLHGLDQRTLMQRMHQCAVAMDAALPGSYRDKVGVLRSLAPKVGHGFVGIFLADFVATFGGDDVGFSLEALSFFTCFGSAEFAVRGFLIADQAGTLQVMKNWAADENEHVRRLASEGSRPRLPWGRRVPELLRDPTPAMAILEMLKHDESIYVRRSVANHLNDITKDHPDRVMELLERWNMEDESLRWIAKHACRTLIKRGHPRALSLFGFGKKAGAVASLKLSRSKLSLGQPLELSAQVTSTMRKPQRLVIDYVIHYVKASGGTAEKVFKWTELSLAGEAAISLSKRQMIRDFTTRKHHAGMHKVELQINGQRVAETVFELRIA